MNSQYEVINLVEGERECGRRKPDKKGAGIYLRGSVGSAGCDRLPFPLQNAGGDAWRPFRGLKVINPLVMFAPNIAPILSACMGDCGYCPLGSMVKRIGDYAAMLFVGSGDYTVKKFTDEAIKHGISRKVADLPKDFVVGKHWVYIAHQHAYTGLDPFSGEIKAMPGIIGAFKPTVDIVIADANNIPDRAKRLKDRCGDSGRIVTITAGQWQ